MKKIPKKTIDDFINQYCNKCKSWVVCGAELVGCPDWEKFIKEKN